MVVEIEGEQSEAVPRLVRLGHVADARGNLVVGELPRLVPFVCRRIFMVYDVPEGTERGGHAHRECHQLLIAVSGHVLARADDGVLSQSSLLDSPQVGLYMPPMTWGLQSRHSKECVLLVLASHPYDASDYIHEYDEFLKVKDMNR